MDRGAGGVILAGALLGALLLVVAEFTALYQIHIATNSTPIESVSGGHNHSYAMLVIGLAAALLGIGVWRSESRIALAGLGVLGVVALLIALLGDLPDAHATGLAGSAARGYANASSTPSAGLYLETLGAVLLIATCGLGFMILGLPRVRRPPPSGGPGPRPAGAPNGSGRDGSGRDDGEGGNGRPPEPGQAPEQDWARRRRSGETPEK